MLVRNLFFFLSPAAFIPELPKDKVDATYKKLRFQVFLGVFFGYAAYYLLRKNFTNAMPYLLKQGFSEAQLGIALSAVSIAYGLSKFLMGNVSDRSNPRYFLALGLLLSAVVNFLFGTVPFLTSSVSVMFIALFINGWFQGMGWPPCGRTMVHWFSLRERGTWVSIWNVAHNIGGGLVGSLSIAAVIIFGHWQSIFYFPAIICLGMVVFIIATVRDTPQSCGLPAIEDYHHEYRLDDRPNRESELTARAIFFTYVLRNKYLWFISFANIFIYFVRYGMIDWVPIYLTSFKGFTHEQSSMAYSIYEYAGIPGTILCGYLSDKLFQGRRAPIGIIYMLLVLAFVFIYFFVDSRSIVIYNVSLIVVGFLIYGPVMLIGLFALDLVPKKAAGTAAGLTGLFGYLGGSLLADAGMGVIVEYFGWMGACWSLVVSCLLSVFFLALTWGQGKTST